MNKQFVKLKATKLPTIEIKTRKLMTSNIFLSVICRFILFQSYTPNRVPCICGGALFLYIVLPIVYLPIKNV